MTAPDADDLDVLYEVREQTMEFLEKLEKYIRAEEQCCVREWVGAELEKYEKGEIR